MTVCFTVEATAHLNKINDLGRARWLRSVSKAATQPSSQDRKRLRQEGEQQACNEISNEPSNVHAMRELPLLSNANELTYSLNAGHGQNGRLGSPRFLPWPAGRPALFVRFLGTSL
jgi:hypothetical protein